MTHEPSWPKVCHAGTTLSPEDARKLEEVLRAAPDDLEARVKLVGHYFLIHDDVSRARRAEHLVWLVRHRPDIGLGGYGTMIREYMPEAYAEARALWIEAAGRKDAGRKVLLAAGSFLTFNEPETAEGVFRKAALAEPDDVEWRERIGHTLVLRAREATDGAEVRRLASLAVDSYEHALKLANEAGLVLGILIEIARAAVSAQRWERVVEVAERVLRENETCGRTWRYGNAIHWANIALGHAAVARGDNQAAARFLRAAAETPGSPQLDSFGPDTDLARALVALGERDAVLQYLERCKAFWTDHAHVIDKWKRVIERGDMPAFQKFDDGEE